MQYVKTIDFEANSVNGGISLEVRLQLPFLNFFVRTYLPKLYHQKAEAQNVVLHSVNGAIHVIVDAEKINIETVNGSVNLKNIGDREVVAINTKTVNGATYISAVSFRLYFSIFWL